MSERPEDSAPVPYRLLIPQALVGLVDSISFMVVAPSLVFYVLQHGGTKEQYGIILSAFSFSSFLFKPILGMWSDRSGGQFRVPYLASIIIAMIGGIIYLLASCWTGMFSIALIFVGRFLGGAGAANSTLGFTYVAQVIPKQHMTKANSLLSMTRILGMVIGPGFNGLLEFVDYKLGRLKLDPLNSVGLVLVLANLFGYVVLYSMLEEPPESTKLKTDSNSSSHSWTFWKNTLRMDILVPLLTVFSLNANFQLLETGLAPAASEALGWSPTTISAIFGGNAVVIFLVVLTTFKLSAMGVKDIQMIKFGCAASVVAYFLMYWNWKHGVSAVQFVGPIVFSTIVFPFLGAPTRSIFTVAVANNEVLARHQGTMQALMSMVTSIAGFVAPSLVAAYILRSPAEVAASDDHREMTAYALFAPLLSLVTLLGVYYVEAAYPDVTCMTPSEAALEEQVALLGETDEGFYEPSMEAARRHSVTLMHIPQLSFHHDPPKRRSSSKV